MIFKNPEQFEFMESVTTLKEDIIIFDHTTLDYKFLILKSSLKYRPI